MCQLWPVSGEEVSTLHFTDDELRCRCGCGQLPPQDFQDELEVLRVDYEREVFEYNIEFSMHISPAMKLSSGWRCPEYNKLVSTTGENGPHTLGAVDVLVCLAASWLLLKVATARRWFGIGVSQKGPHSSRFLHLDQLTEGTRPTVWSY